MKSRRYRGIVLVSVMSLVMVVLMFIAALLKRGENGLFRSAFYRDGIQATQAAKGGYNHINALLTQDPTYEDRLDGDLGPARYSITFDVDQAHYSVNNLTSPTPAPVKNAQGRTVAPFTADLMVTGVCGQRTRIVHVVVQRSFSDGRSIAATGRVVLSGEVRVEGVKNLIPPPGHILPEPAPGGILSKYRSTDLTDPAISWDDLGGATFQLSDLSRLETAPAHTGGQSISPNLKSLFSGQTISDGAADSIPDIDVVNIVADGMSSPPLQPSGSSHQGYVYVDEDHSVSHSLTVNGTLSLTGGTLYVDGDLTVNGNIEGTGTVYASGDINVQGGSAIVVTDHASGAAILAGGDVNLVGLDVSGYLRALSNAYGFEPSVDRLDDLFGNYRSAVSASQFVDVAESFGQSDSTRSDLDSYIDRPWISPHPGPNGTHSYGRSNSAANRLTLRLKSDHTTLDSDRKAQKVVKALEQVQHHFRDSGRTIMHNGEHYMTPYFMLHHYYTLGEDYRLYEVGSTEPQGDYFYRDDPNLMFNPAWDDSALPEKYHTHRHLGPTNAGLHKQRRNAFLAHNNPLDEEWMGDSSFQGVVYARGDVNADVNFKVIGAVRSLGDVTLKNGSTLIYNEDYRDLVGTRLPLGLIHYEEL